MCQIPIEKILADTATYYIGFSHKVEIRADLADEKGCASTSAPTGDTRQGSSGALAGVDATTACYLSSSGMYTWMGAVVKDH
jgi:hypothetical protein